MLYSFRLFVFILFFSSLSLPSLWAEDEVIYLFKDRYNIQTQKKIEQSLIDFREIEILGGYMIDPKKEGVIDFETVDRYLKKLYPDKNQSGLLCINLENELFHDIRNNDVNSILCQEAINKFIDLILFVKLQRPNIKVGIYGIPFTVYYDSQLKRNADNKLDMLLWNTDVIFPSLYIFYPAKQKGLNSNFEYLKKNLEISFDHAHRLGKPIIPFFWYFVHPSSKQYRYEMLPKEEVDKYMAFISNYISGKGGKVSGIVWWDTPTPFNNEEVKTNLLELKNNYFTNLDLAFKYYFLD